MIGQLFAAILQSDEILQIHSSHHQMDLLSVLCLDRLMVDVNPTQWRGLSTVCDCITYTDPETGEQEFLSASAVFLTYLSD
jgi:hypothetical protein